MTVQQLVTFLLKATFDGRINKDDVIKTADEMDVKVVLGGCTGIYITDTNDWWDDVVEAPEWEDKLNGR